VATPLTWTDPLPLRPRRVLVAGNAGSGKSTLARALATALSLPYHELDALFHGPEWTPRPEFADDVEAFAATDRWVAEWQYIPVRARLLERADLMIWLDLPRWRVMTQITRRTIIRRLRRVELWNGNIEYPLWTIFTERDHILRWAWAAHARSRRHVLNALASPGTPPVIRLRSRRELRAWLTRL
jgi:adenylate kinase family enzyme